MDGINRAVYDEIFVLINIVINFQREGGTYTKYDIVVTNYILKYVYKLYVKRKNFSLNCTST